MQKAAYGLDDLLERCTVRLWSPEKRKFGTGFFVAPGRIVTCAHVTGQRTAQRQLLSVEWGDKTLSAALIKLFPDPCPSDQIFPDVALLELIEDVEHPVVLIDPDFAKGDPISSWGFSDLRPGGESIYGSCEGSGKYDHSAQTHLIKFKETQIRPGISGAPLLNERTAAVCGMIKRTRDSEVDAGGLAVRGELLLELLQEPLGDESTQKMHASAWLDARRAADTTFQQYLAALKGYTSSAYRALPLPNGLGIDDVYVPLRLRSLDVNVVTGVFELRELFRNLTFSPKGRNVLVEAAPGAGKSTLLRYIAHNSFDHPDELGLDGRRIPLLLRLQSLAMTTGPGIEDRLLSAIANARDYQLRTPLVSGFFFDWPRSLDARWLLLLDGFDEVPKDNRDEIIRFMQQLEELGCELFVTTRPTESLGTSYARHFNQYGIEIFTSDQQRALAEKWFDSEATQFLASVKASGNDFLGSTPLLLTIAASVFSESRQLPPRRVDLYKEFIDRWWEEAISRGVREELSDELGRSPLAALQEVARLMIESDDLVKTADVAEALTKVLAPKIGRAPDLLRPEVDRFLEIMGRRSGVFIVRGASCEWLHRTFREYLCARAFAIIHPDSQEAISIVKNWREDQWRQVVLFSVSFWSERHSVAPLLRRIAKLSPASLANPNPVASLYGLVFAADSIAEGALVEPDLQRDIIKHLCREAITNSEGTICVRLMAGITDDSIKRADETLRALLELRKLPESEPHFSQLIKAMVSFARDWRQDMGNAAVSDLAALGCRSELLDIANDERLHDWVRYQAARELIERGPDANASDALYRQITGKPRSATVATRILDVLGEAGASAQLLELAKSDSMDLDLRVHIAEVFDKHAMIEALGSLKVDNEADPSVRERALWGLLGKTPSADSHHLIGELLTCIPPGSANGERLVDALAGMQNWDGVISVVEYPGADSSIVEGCISRLTSYDRVEELGHLVGSANLPFNVRLLAAEGLRKKAKAGERKDQLLRFYSEYLEQKEDDLAVLKERGKLFLEVGQFAEAIGDFNILVSLDENDEWSLGLRGNAFRLSGQYVEAIADFDRALALDSGDSWDLSRRAVSHWQLRHSYEAASDFAKAFELGSTENEFYAYYADCLCDLGKFEEAFAIACKAVDFEFMSAMPYAIRGSIHSAVGRWEQATMDFSQALLLTSKYEWALRERAVAYRCSQQFLLCLDDLNTLLNSSEDDRHARFARCEVSLRIGDHITATQDLALLSYDRPRTGWLLYLYWLSAQSKGRAGNLDSELRSLREDLERRSASNSLNDYELSNLAIYQVAVGEFDKARAIYEAMIRDGKLRFLIQTALPELTDLASIVPGDGQSTTLYNDLIGRIDFVPQKFELKGGVGVTQGRYGPMYCRKHSIAGLSEEKERADNLLSRHADRRRTIVIWRLEDDWVYGQCNFKHSDEDQYTFKFVDRLETVLKRDLEMFVAADLKRILFLEEELRKAFEANQDADLDSFLVQYDLIEDGDSIASVRM
jgi:tetratricopeptide (TPR) repeat protein